MTDPCSGPDYNAMFENLVLRHEEDSIDRLIGMLAYADYKLHKRNFCRAIETREDRPPTPEEIRTFVTSCQSSHFIQTLTDKHRDVLFTFAYQYSEDRVQEAVQAARENSVVDAIKSATGFWSSVWTNIVASFIFALLAAVVLIVIALTRPDSGLSDFFFGLVGRKG
jgi:hypothetical protein